MKKIITLASLLSAGWASDCPILSVPPSLKEKLKTLDITLQESAFLPTAHLHIDPNQVQGGIPDSIEGFLELKTFSAPSNWLTGELPFALFCLNNLNVLDLEQNNLTGQISENIENLSALQTLLLGGKNQSPPNMLYEEHNFWYGRRNRFHGPIPNALGRLNNLRILHLDNNDLEGGIPDTFSNLTQLTELSLIDNKLSGILPEWLWSLNQLEVLAIGHHPCKKPHYSDFIFQGTLPESILNLSKLRVLNLRGNRLTGPIPHNIGRLPLEKLQLSGNHFEPSLPERIGHITTLQVLELDSFSNHPLNTHLPVWLTSLTKLRNLNLSCCGFEGPIPTWIGECTTLKKLSLSNNRLTDAIPKIIGQLSQLQILFLDRNQLTGRIPSSIGNLESLTFLGLSHNPLTGDIPGSIKKLQKLEEFSLRNTNITGQSSDYREHIPGIQFVDLSQAGIKSPINLVAGTVFSYFDEPYDHFFEDSEA